ncbi:DinB family protein [Fictibacillus gelatini]|uniref:DinB family protein n=1 Tax=Fictibacillus gelatini TaxID=225985 RepID=UPI0004022ACE|nr:DinB family protein [Fictibacillus gelatini]
MKDKALKLYNYHVWANKKVFQHLKELPGDLVTKEIQSVFPSIFEALTHVYVADNVWLGVMAEESFDEIRMKADQLTEEAKGKSIEELEQLFEECSERYRSFLESQDDFDRIISPEHPRFGKLDTKLFELIQHVVNHGTYHRGNIAAMLRQMGHPGIPTDYIFYLMATNANV